MSRTHVLGAMVMAALVVATASPAMAVEPSLFESMTVPYETVRQALLQDTLEGVAVAAAELKRLAGAESREPVPAIRSAAAGLAEASSLEVAREAFADLSRSMVRFRQMTPNPEPVVVFCSMAQKVWLQPKGEIGNPYHGQSMARCGVVVSE